MKTESVPLGELKKMAEDKMLLFDEELMSFAMGNCITLEDTNGNRKLYKTTIFTAHGFHPNGQHQNGGRFLSDW